jgi:hypothetical protein
LGECPLFQKKKEKDLNGDGRIKVAPSKQGIGANYLYVYLKTSLKKLFI